MKKNIYDYSGNAEVSSTKISPKSIKKFKDYMKKLFKKGFYIDDFSLDLSKKEKSELFTNKTNKKNETNNSFR